MGEIWSAKRIRDTYFNFFTDKGHTVVDPLLFSYGMNQNQYKPRFLGVADPQSEFMNLKRACHSQKWIRAGESHSDHTSFEMLGNCSIGDYFKEEAIAWAWELLTKVYGLEADHIYATYFGGDEKAGLEPDNEARDIWLRFLPSRRVLPFGYKDNFWEMGGDTGLCGPCTKIHYYNRDAPTCMNIWNILFIQFTKELDGLKPLLTKHVDTRFEYERVTSILQNKVTTSYDKGNLMEHVIVLNDSENPHHLRSKALIELTNMDLSDQNFAKLLWFSKTTNLLVKEIAYAKTTTCESDLLTWERTDHVLRLLRLLQVVVEVPEARASLLNGLVYFYLSPFVTATGTEETTELLRRQSLKVLNSLLKVGHPHNEHLIYNGLVHWCLRTIPVGSESTRELALETIEKVIDLDVGFIYVISDRDRLWEVVHGMSLAVSGFRFPPLLSTLVIAIRCFHRLAQNDSIAYELKRFIPRSFRDGTFEDIVDAEEYIAMLVELETRFG